MIREDLWEAGRFGFRVQPKIRLPRALVRNPYALWRHGKRRRYLLVRLGYCYSPNAAYSSPRIDIQDSGQAMCACHGS